MRIVTDKYYMSFNGLDTDLCANIQLTKKEFQRQMKFLKGQIGKPVIDEMVVEYRSYEDNGEKLRQIRHYFTAGTAETELVEMHCNAGFCFKE